MVYRRKKRSSRRPKRRSRRRGRKTFLRGRTRRGATNSIFKSATFIAPSRKIKFTFQRDMKISPAVSANTFSRLSFRANCPFDIVKDIYPPEGTVPGWRSKTIALNSPAENSAFGVGQFVYDDTSSEDYNTKYRQAIVTHSEITITAKPQADVALTGHQDTSFLTLTKATMPANDFYGGTLPLVVDSTNDNNAQQQRMRPMTVQGKTTMGLAYAPRGCTLRMKYNARRMNAIASKTKLAFSGMNLPTEKDYFHVSLLQDDPIDAETPTPHDVNVKITYYCVLSEPGNKHNVGNWYSRAFNSALPDMGDLAGMMFQASTA